MQENKKLIHYTFVISSTDADQRIDQVLPKLMPDFSRTQIQQWIEQGAVLVDQRPVKTKFRLIGGETVTIQATLKPVVTWQAEAIPLNIVYEDNELLVINKPVGMVVHPGAGNRDHTLLNALLHHAPTLETLARAGILHRLDKNTSGLLVIAKTPGALKNLALQLKKRTLKREYQAIVYGTMISGGSVDAPIARHPTLRTRMAVVETGKHAITHYRIAEKYRAHTRLNIRLETGRTHQIRVHMAHIHHPIIGDVNYGGRVRLVKNMTPALIQALRQFKRQALHASLLGFTHPITRETMQFQAPLPEDMQQLITILKNDLRHQ